MLHVICINQNSFPAHTIEQGLELFNDALQGVLALQNGDDRFDFYLDANVGNLSEFEIADGLTYQSFIDQCQDNDLQLFLYEVEDKCPALDHLSDEQIEEMSAYLFYIQNRAIDDSVDVYSLTWMLSGYLLSLANDPIWQQSEIELSRVDGHGQFVEGQFFLKNIATTQHGNQHAKALYSVDLKNLLAPHQISTELFEWFNSQTKEDQTRIISKLGHTKIRDFDGGEPLFKPLHDGLREVRFSAHAGGAVRILFKPYDTVQRLLWGFIKKRNDEGYDEGIRKAKQIYDGM